MDMKYKLIPQTLSNSYTSTYIIRSIQISQPKEGFGAFVAVR